MLDIDKKYRENYNAMLASYNQYKGRHDTLQPLIQDTEKKILDLDSKNQQAGYVYEVLNKVGEKSRENAKIMFEKLVTDALQYTTQDNTIKFVIENLGTHAKPAYEFFIETSTMGTVSKKRITSGGFTDVCSTVLNTTYYELFNDPKIKNIVMLLDEPGKMISNDMGLRFMHYIKFIGKQFNRQPIMITHEDSWASVADKSWYVSMTNGISKVSENTGTILLDDINKKTEELLHATTENETNETKKDDV